MQRQSGVLLPVFSLPGEYGCGNFGSEAYKWIDRLVKGGFSLWQVLPFGVSDSHNSPYMSYSSFGGNPYFIDPYTLYEKGLITSDELDEQKVSDVYLCDYGYLAKHRIPLLKKAASRVKNREEILDFMKRNPEINGTCAFLALREKNGDAGFRDWKVNELTPDELFPWQFMQYEFRSEWDKLHAYAKKQGVGIIGDLPFYVSEDSYDVYASPESFLFDKDGRPEAVAGVPPDYFSEDGQLWGNPIYDWETLEKDGFGWWKKRFAYMLDLFDGVRIDHFRAISAYWSIPRGAKSAKEGSWVKGPGEKLIDSLKAVSKGKLVIAEDLGIIDDDTRKLLKYSKYPGMAVFQFGFDGNYGNTHLPHNYPENIIAYTGTHDNNTLLGFMWEADEHTRELVYDYLGYPKDACGEIIRNLMMSSARAVIMPVQDLLGYGADTRINVPGIAENNWRYRITTEQIGNINLDYFRHLNTIYSRVTK